MKTSRRQRDPIKVVTEAARKARAQLDLAIHAAAAQDEDLACRLEQVRDLLTKAVSEIDGEAGDGA